MKPTTLRRKLKKKAPKTWAKIEKRWDIKIADDVTRFALDVGLYNIETIEEMVWKLLKKARRLK